MAQKQTTVAVKRAQAENWREVAATRLERAEEIERMWTPVSRHMLELVGCKRGDRVLDVGTGHGEPALTAASVVGATGAVVAVDLSEEMIEVAKTRRSAAGLDWVDLYVRDAEDLQLEVDPFDVAVSRMTLMYCPDPTQALREILGLLRPGGRFCLSLVGPERTQAFWMIPAQAICAELGVEMPAPEELGKVSNFGLSDCDLVRGCLDDAGFSDVVVNERDEDYDYESSDQLVDFLTINPRVMSLFDGQPQERIDQAWDAVRTAVADRAGDDGHVRMTSPVIYGTGTRA